MKHILSVSQCVSLAPPRELLKPKISREMYHARLSGVPNDVALNHCGQSGTEHFVCIG